MSEKFVSKAMDENGDGLGVCVMHSRPNAYTLVLSLLSFYKRTEPYLHSSLLRFSVVTCFLFSGIVPFTLLLLILWFCVFVCLFVFVLYRHNFLLCL